MERALQNEYLRAMGIDVWLRRGADDFGSAPADAAGLHLAAPAPRERSVVGAGLVIGPGSGGLLLVCAGPEDSALPIAADIARCLDGEPVWGWPAPDADGMPMEEAIRDRLFTGVLVFGDADGGDAAASDAAIRGSARFLRAAALPVLAADPDARRSLWSRLRATDWCAPRRVAGAGA